jgi:hypothetical protein
VLNDESPCEIPSRDISKTLKEKNLHVSSKQATCTNAIRKRFNAGLYDKLDCQEGNAINTPITNIIDSNPDIP